MTKTRMILLGVIGIFGIGIWGALSDRSDQQLADALAAEALARQQQASSRSVVPQSALPQSDVERLTDEVISDGDKINGAWVVEIRGSARPRIKLPARPTRDGDLIENTQPNDQAKREPDQGFVGADACAECHHQRHQGFVQTAHHLTSQVGSAADVLGPLRPPGNQLATDDSRLSFTMSEENGRAYQNMHLADWSLPISMDVIVGSGKLAQTFLFWNGEALFEAHVSYFRRSGKWLASPGFNDVDANYARPIRSECLECHVTYIAEKKRPNEYHRDSVVWGISCERCHGPGRKHVDYHHQSPDVTTAKYIANPSDLPRERQLDLCGQCHSGEFKFRDRPFRFRPGDDITDFHKLVHPESEQSGVHTSNQLTRLKRSECFRHSEMICTTCHDPHQLQRDDVLTFSKACLKCHEVDHCGGTPLPEKRLADDCISCHMPKSKNADLLDMATKGAEVWSVDHFIRVTHELVD